MAAYVIIGEHPPSVIVEKLRLSVITAATGEGMC